ncbi:hypothetical protein F4861DRAFT_236283 [Xylaria intraflava]|nr:hypothetical protein F4861DRAFT_236283 [Xylaria intraflava]
MERPLICSSLRKRPDWTSLPPLLLASGDVCGKWKEAQLDTHDVAVPLRTPGPFSQRVFRALFMSPRDVGSVKSSSRIERLYHVNGGRDVGIVFLLQHEDGQQSAVASFMTLQLQLVADWELPIIPVESVAAVPASLVTLKRQLDSPVTSRKLPDPARNLLPYCSDKGRLAEHTVHVLTDTTSGFRDLLGKLSSDAVFQSEIVPLLDRDANGLRNFFTNEYLVD